jgi:hypothetical protein
MIDQQKNFKEFVLGWSRVQGLLLKNSKTIILSKSMASRKMCMQKTAKVCTQYFIQKNESL